MATVNSILQSRPLGSEVPNTARLRHLSRIYRAHICPASVFGPERTAFVEAFSHRDAARKIAAVVAGLEDRTPDAVEGRIYNVSSARECIDDGLSDDVELRVFEIGWIDGKPSFVEEPLFLVSSPALLRKWAQVVDTGVRHV